MAYIIKQIPEDFYVEEISNVELNEEGNFTYFILEKHNYSTEKAIQTLAKYHNLPRKAFGYAGSKDKVAHTKQVCSVKGKIGNNELKDLKVSVLGKGMQPISLGDLEANKFEIVVRNIDSSPTRIEIVMNLFDSQRFGIKGNNHEVGKAILKKDFKRAVELIQDSVRYRQIDELLKSRPNDYVSALRLIPKKTLTMYVHAYQSFIWNETVRRYYEKNKSEDLELGIPLVGFGTELGDSEIDNTIKEILESEQVSLNEFVIRAIPELSSEGNMRNAFAEVQELSISKLEDDELNKGRKKCKVSFTLSKGSYATNVIKQMFSQH